MWVGPVSGWVVERVDRVRACVGLALRHRRGSETCRVILFFSSELCGHVCASCASIVWRCGTDEGLVGSVVQLETHRGAVVPDHLLHERRLLVVPSAPTILEGMLELVAELLCFVQRL